jgi:hypothetical protein
VIVHPPFANPIIVTFLQRECSRDDDALRDPRQPRIPDRIPFR